MDIVFRTDSSREIGTGHVMRCLTLADALKEKGCRALFICRDFAGNIGGLVRAKGHEVVYLPHRQDEPDPDDRVFHAAWLGTSWQQDAEDTATVLRERFDRPVDWLVVDHYGIDAKWEKTLRPYTRKIMVIDDLADRPHDCDLLLDQNLYENMEKRYDGLVPPGAIKLLGPKYALLRPEFYRARQSIRQRDGTVRRILVFFGGSDPTNETLKALKAIKMLDRPDIAVDVVIGSSNLHKEEIAAFCRDMPQVTLHCQVDNMAELMANADLAIGAGGTTTWERCYLGLPTITIIIADNQAEVLTVLAQNGVIWNLGFCHSVRIVDITQAVRKLTNCRICLKTMEKLAQQLLDSADDGYEVVCLKYLL
ncbi:UDP-2,4-diacetamido-2,4,6-trideoxy-beta-L-altropyranose hydrolase [Sporolituus thermophilus]|uniref:UDP-2,4-diacetamido-2,4,6-trideoxy-beta-L-altropyranose hydrolase n=1 Tax=Sporolituus thermophilus DSM 23256 TaxID=1123285 RepID=A0A1G7P0M1_9FIRM|nr:UDP-2,4-diacetamido-2,4,6-trideoxy-beta-L-altropyranose hydrolase [Sporolituus thermophilus]SDF79793.1 UDP-2,4-diacetamido-2,4,6-trideoxy-beta-L-altropyranose hydrolase [Sporolituus thermophilus DSM 23256]